MKKDDLIPSLENIKAAHKLILPYIHKTPVLSSSIINKLAGCEIFFKCENFQKSGAFKFRGATNTLLRFLQDGLKGPVITHSSGNHAGALAKASGILGVECIVVMPKNAPEVKVEAVKHYGGKIHFCEPTLQAREETTEKLISEIGATLVHPYDNKNIIAGQGTAALELLEQEPDLDSIITPVGGGGLLSGSSITSKSLRKNIKVFGAEPEGADDAYRSFKSGKLIPSENPNTIADGLLTSLSERTFYAISNFVDDILTISDREIIDALKLIFRHLKIITEPSSAVTLAVVLKYKEMFKGKKAGLILTGGNLNLNYFNLNNS